MAILKILKCKSCGRPLNPDTRKCLACGTENVIQTEVNPLEMTAELAQEYVAFFKQKKDENPQDQNALYAMGLLYLGLQNYELSQRNFKEAVDLSPFEPDTYYYYALSLIGGQTINQISYDNAQRIETYLNTGIAMHKKRKYLILLMLLRQGAYIANGLSFKGEHPSELLAEIKTILPEGGEIEEIRTHSRIVDSHNLTFLDELQGTKDENKVKSKGRGLRINYSNYSCPMCGSPLSLKSPDLISCHRCQFECSKVEFDKNRQTFMCQFASQRDYVLNDVTDERLQELNDSNERLLFIDAMFQPEKRKSLRKPFYPLKKYFVRLLKMAVLTIIAMIIVGISNFGNKTINIPAKIDNDLIEEVKSFKENYIIIAHDELKEKDQEVFTWGAPAEDIELAQIASYSGIENSFKGLGFVLIIFLPFLIWILMTIFNILSVIKQRKSIGRENKENKTLYKKAMDDYAKRPIVKEIVEYSRHFLAKNSEVVTFGDPVQDAIESHDIDESNLTGKILFLNGFNPEGIDYLPADDLFTRIYYMIVLPQKESVLLLPSYWDIRSNELVEGNAVSIFYRNITSVSIIDNTIEIETSSGNTQELALPKQQESLLHYQSEDPTNRLTYSLTRTSDPNEFKRAIDKLIINHHK